MLFRRYGTHYQSVDPAFDSKALSEVGFRRNRERSIPAEELERDYELVERVELVAEAEGDVQDETEQVLLDRLEERLRAALAGLDGEGIAVVENEMGHDYPKTRQDISTVTSGHENRLHFRYTISPPLRVATYRLRG